MDGLKKLGYQEELMTIFFKNPALLKEPFDDELLPDKKYRELRKVMMQTYERYNRIELKHLQNVPGIDIFEFEEWVNQIERCDIIDFKYLRRLLIDEKKKIEINDAYARLSTGTDSVDYFLSAMRDIKADANTAARKIDSVDLEMFLAHRDTRIKFKNFDILERRANINEGDFVVLAGGTGVGKTALAINLALDLAEHYPILYINIELSKDTILKRMIACYTDTLMKSIDNRLTVPQIEIDKMKRLGDYLDEHEIYLITGSQTVESIRETVSEFPQDKHFIVIIDHIGRITSDKDSYERMTKTSIDIRNLALDFNCTVFGLCQLNRSWKGLEEPSNHLLRDSGEVEQSARKVIFLWQKEKGDNLGLYLWLTKNDSGECGQIRIRFNKENQRITEVTNG